MDIWIETPRLVLRPWREDDIEQLATGMNDLEVSKWLALVPHPYTTVDAISWITRCRKMSRSGTRPNAYEFAIERKDDGLLIGGVSLNKIDWQAETGGGGIWIASPSQGLGYGRESLEAKIRFAFRELGLAKLLNGYFEGNESSWAVQRQLGYRRIAEVPAHCLADGRQTVEHVTALLRKDWEARAE